MTAPFQLPGESGAPSMLSQAASKARCYSSKLSSRFSSKLASKLAKRSVQQSAPNTDKEDATAHAQAMHTSIEDKAKCLKEGMAEVNRTWVVEAMQMHQQCVASCCAANIDGDAFGTADFVLYIMSHPKVEAILRAAADGDDLPPAAADAGGDPDVVSVTASRTARRTQDETVGENEQVDVDIRMEADDCPSTAQCVVGAGPRRPSEEDGSSDSADGAHVPTTTVLTSAPTCESTSIADSTMTTAADGATSVEEGAMTTVADGATSLEEGGTSFVEGVGGAMTTVADGATSVEEGGTSFVEGVGGAADAVPQCEGDAAEATLFAAPGHEEDATEGGVPSASAPAASCAEGTLAPCREEVLLAAPDYAHASGPLPTTPPGDAVAGDRAHVPSNAARPILVCNRGARPIGTQGQRGVHNAANYGKDELAAKLAARRHKLGDAQMLSPRSQHLSDSVARATRDGGGAMQAKLAARRRLIEENCSGTRDSGTTCQRTE